MEKNMDLYLVEDHNTVLEPLYNKIGRNKLPFDNMVLLHFDSHSDLSCPKELNADDSFNKQRVFDLTSIESWILPALYNGHFNHVIWIKPFWTKESFQEYSEFFIGRSLSTKKICVTSTDNYFLSECIYEPLDNLDNSKLVKLTVITIEEFLVFLDKDDLIGKLSVIIRDIINILSTAQNGYILDIDLDFFSTQNPFLSALPSQCWNLMLKLYEFIPPQDLNIESILHCVKDRKLQLDYLRDALNNSESFCNSEDKISTRDDIIKELLKELSDSKETDLDYIHEIGSGIDDCPLPHHVSTRQQICGLMNVVECILEKLKTPLAIAIARSSCDDYCPAHQVEMIQKTVLDILQRIYDNKITINVLYAI